MYFEAMWHGANKLEKGKRNKPVEHELQLAIHNAGSSHSSVNQHWELCAVVFHKNPKIKLQQKQIRFSNVRPKQEKKDLKKRKEKVRHTG